MKNLQASKKFLAIGSLIVGAILLFTPATIVAQNNFSYTNPGQRTYMDVTNNAAGSNFTIFAAGYANGTLPILGNLTVTNESMFYIGGFQILTNATGHQVQYHYSGLTINASFISTLNSTLAGSILSGIASTYVLTGTGANDSVHIVGGLTPDIYSLVFPGFGANVNITTGAGDATYAIQVGLNSSINITPASYLNDTTTGTTTVFNIVYNPYSY